METPHRCFLSAYENELNSFGLSVKITLTQELRAKYLRVYNTATSDCVIHFHCLADGSVKSFGIKYLATERVGGDNLIINQFFLPKATDHVKNVLGVTGLNVNAKYGNFN